MLVNFFLLVAGVGLSVLVAVAVLAVILLLFRVAEWAVEKFWVLLISIGLLGCSHMPVALTETDIYSRLADSAVVVETDRGSGSGTIIFNDHRYLLALTCAHVVDEGAKDFTLTTFDGQRLPAQLLKIDERNDLALLLAESTIIVTAPALRVAKADPPLFSRLYSVAAPLGSEHTAAPQLLSGKDDMRWRLSGFALFGSSGGTVANSSLELVCVIQSVRMFGPFPITTMGGCIPLSTIQTFLSGYSL